MLKGKVIPGIMGFSSGEGSEDTFRFSSWEEGIGCGVVAVAFLVVFQGQSQRFQYQTELWQVLVEDELLVQ